MGQRTFVVVEADLVTVVGLVGAVVHDALGVVGVSVGFNAENTTARGMQHIQQLTHHPSSSPQIEGRRGR